MASRLVESARPPKLARGMALVLDRDLEIRRRTRKYPQMFAKTTFVLKVFEYFTYTRRRWATMVAEVNPSP